MLAVNTKLMALFSVSVTMKLELNVDASPEDIAIGDCRELNAELLNRSFCLFVNLSVCL